LSPKARMVMEGTSWLTIASAIICGMATYYVLSGGLQTWLATALAVMVTVVLLMTYALLVANGAGVMAKEESEQWRPPLFKSTLVVLISFLMSFLVVRFVVDSFALQALLLGESETTEQVQLSLSEQLKKERESAYQEQVLKHADLIRLVESLPNNIKSIPEIAQQPEITNAPRKALLIVNSSYDNSEDELSSLVDSTQELKEALTNVGFRVELVENVTTSEMNTAIQQFESSLADGDMGLFYFGGYATAKFGSPRMLAARDNGYVSVDSLLEATKGTKMQAAYWLLDVQSPDAESMYDLKALDANLIAINRNLKTSPSLALKLSHGADKMVSVQNLIGSNEEIWSNSALNRNLTLGSREFFNAQLSKQPETDSQYNGNVTLSDLFSTECFMSAGYISARDQKNWLLQCLAATSRYFEGELKQLSKASPIEASGAAKSLLVRASDSKRAGASAGMESIFLTPIGYLLVVISTLILAFGFVLRDHLKTYMKEYIINETALQREEISSLHAYYSARHSGLALHKDLIDAFPTLPQGCKDGQ